MDRDLFVCQDTRTTQEVGDVQCNLCSKVCIESCDPVLCEEEHVFCRACIAPELQRAKPVCPVDGAELPPRLISSKRVARAASRLLVKCPYYSSGFSLRVTLGQVPGCRWRGTVNESREHISACEYRPVRCERPGCGELVMYRGLRLHEMTCSNAMEECIYCGKDVMVKDADSHLDICEGLSVPCPNSCLVDCPSPLSVSAQAQVVYVKRKNVNAHRENCPLEPVQCPFRPLGCEKDGKRLVRCDLKAHLEQYRDEHILLLLQNTAASSKKRKRTFDYGVARAGKGTEESAVLLERKGKEAESTGSPGTTPAWAVGSPLESGLEDGKNDKEMSRVLVKLREEQRALQDTFEAYSLRLKELEGQVLELQGGHVLRLKVMEGQVHELWEAQKVRLKEVENQVLELRESHALRLIEVENQVVELQRAHPLWLKTAEGQVMKLQEAHALRLKEVERQLLDLQRKSTAETEDQEAETLKRRIENQEKGPGATDKGIGISAAKTMMCLKPSECVRPLQDGHVGPIRRPLGFKLTKLNTSPDAKPKCRGDLSEPLSEEALD